MSFVEAFLPPKQREKEREETLGNPESGGSVELGRLVEGANEGPLARLRLRLLSPIALVSKLEGTFVVAGIGSEAFLQPLQTLVAAVGVGEEAKEVPVQAQRCVEEKGT